MPRVHVCSLQRIGSTVAQTGASHLVTLINQGTPVQRPPSIPAERHLFLGFNDILEPMDGMTAPAEEHVVALLDFLDDWNAEKPIVVHCFAGISRSTAAAFITLCAVKPERDEHDIARRLRAASPYAFPNARLVAFADRVLERDGRMVRAIQSIGRGEMVAESVPFALSVEE